MDNLLITLLFLCPSLFIAGVIDAIAGGGGIISLPAYIMTGVPLNIAYGCNKFQSGIGTGTALFMYAKSGYVDFKAGIICAIPALIMAHLSTLVMLELSDTVKKIIIVVAMIFIITLMLLTNKRTSGTNTSVPLNKNNIFLSLLTGFILGIYDGFFGPGCGTIALMLFTYFFRYDMRVASGTGKVAITITNLVALASYIASGNIMYQIAIPATVSNMIGGYVGAILAVKNGRKLVKKLMIAVVLIVLVQAVIKLV